MSINHSHDHVGGLGHNAAHHAAQWQTPHLPEGSRTHAAHAEPDADLIEEAFVEGFPRATDPTSFLRLAGVPMVGKAADGKDLRLLRVEISQKTDVGSLSPYLGGTGHRYDPLPAKMVSRRQLIIFVYFDGDGVQSLSLSEARALEQLDP
jgi:hypothetical protein